MRRTEQIVYNVTGQSLVHRFIQGRPTAVTFKVFEDGEDDDADPEFEGSASIDTVSTTVDATSGKSQADPHKLSVAATTALVTGRLYRLTEDGHSRFVEPVEIVSGDYVRLRHALRHDYAVGATLESTYASVAIDATFIADIDNINDHEDPNPGWRVRLEATIGGSGYVEYAFFDVVRGLVEPHIAISDIEAHGCPNLADTLPAHYRPENGQSLVSAAERIMRSNLHAIDLNDAALRDNEVLDEYTILIAKRLLASGGWKPSGWEVGEFYTATMAEEERFYERHFSISAKHHTVSGAAGDASLNLSEPIWVK